MICRGSLDIIFPLGVLESLGGAQWSSVGALPLFLLLSLLETLLSFLFGVDPLVCLLVLHRSETPQLFTVLPEKRTATVGGAGAELRPGRCQWRLPTSCRLLLPGQASGGMHVRFPPKL